MKCFILSLLVLASASAVGQVSYSGFIDKYPIELYTNIYSDGAAGAIYAYTLYDEPIDLSGRLANKTLTLYETGMAGEKSAVLIFNEFDASATRLEGTWTSLKTKRQFSVTLDRTADIENKTQNQEDTAVFLQRVSGKKHYFKVSAVRGENGRIISKAVKIMEKETDKLIQQIAVDCQFMDYNSIDVADYNFDGIQDFSIFESSYSGPNTSRIYFLYNVATATYLESSFSGTSLEFDAKTKRIFETNQCCAGRSVETTEYKAVDNKMVPVKKTCTEYDEKSGKYRKIKCS